jgi:hypothetical protein
VIRSAVHAATRCALAITILLPEFKLENIACEEGKKRGSLQPPIKQGRPPIGQQCKSCQRSTTESDRPDRNPAVIVSGWWTLRLPP